MKQSVHGRKKQRQQREQQQITNCTILCIPKRALFALGLHTNYTHSERDRASERESDTLTFTLI